MGKETESPTKTLVGKYIVVDHDGMVVDGTFEEREDAEAAAHLLTILSDDKVRYRVTEDSNAEPDSRRNVS